MTTTSLALVGAPATDGPPVSAPAATDTPPVDSAASRGDDALTPEAILRTLATEIGSDPFAGGKRAHAIRTAGQSLRGALDRVRAAHALVAECEAEVQEVADRALAVLTGK